MEALEKPATSANSRIHEMVGERLVRAPKKIRNKISKEIYQNNIFIVSYSMSNIFAALVISKDYEKEVRSRAKVGMQPVPGLIVPANEIASSAFAFEHSHNIIIANSVVEGCYALSVGWDCSIIIDRLTVSVTDDLDKEYRTQVELGFIISGEGGRPIFSADEAVSDLISYYISKMRS